MQTSKLFFVVCACALLAGDSYLRAAESEAQKKAREALRQKMQLEGQPQPAAPPAPAAPPQPTVAPPQAVVPATPPPTAPVAAPVPRSADSDAQAKAREALRQKYNEGQVQQPGASATVAAPATPAAPTASPFAPHVATWSAGAGDNAAQAKAREALWLKMRELDSQQPVAPPIGTPVAPAVPTVAFKPIEPPPAAISGTKSGKLAELLRQYRADQITPEEYHKQRAAILAEQ